MFLRLYQNSMYDADNAMRDSIIIYCLYAETQTIILPRLPENSWTFAYVSRTLTQEFGSQEALLGCKMDFADTNLKVGETLEDFTSRFYLEAQALSSMSAVQFIDVQSALLNAVRVNQELSLALKSGIYNPCTVPDLICLLYTYKEEFEVSFPKGCPHQQAEYRPCVAVEMPKPSNKVGPTPANNSPCTCFKCDMAGHFSQECRNCCVWLLGTTSRRTQQKIFITKDLRLKASLGLAFRAKLRAHTLISWNTR
ncbi:hypothetical protein DSO57_1005320 [Entomophthora muscae]|uniref:Uncharacterized protein n=1 Tax=Entomophthora muscae TaxID=34485 RepID=A0ACC2UTV5_9FUNG|nr:hypothetical protein DSO57_1005320 [Entomophthora muscae]